MAKFVELFGATLLSKDGKKYLSTPGEAGLDEVNRGQTKNFVGILQKSLAALFCGTIFLIAHCVAIGWVWLWASKETQRMTTMTLTAAIGNVTATTGDVAWSQWYRSQGIVVLVFDILAGLMILTKVVVNYNRHVAKADYFTAAGRLEEAADKEAEEGTCVKMCICCTNVLTPSIWCCVGLFMTCFGGFIGLSMVAVQSGWDDNSKYHALIQINLFSFGLIGMIGFGAAFFTSGPTHDLEAEK